MGREQFCSRAWPALEEELGPGLKRGFRVGGQLDKFVSLPEGAFHSVGFANRDLERFARQLPHEAEVHCTYLGGVIIQNTDRLRLRGALNPKFFVEFPQASRLEKIAASLGVDRVDMAADPDAHPAVQALLALRSEPLQAEDLRASRAGDIGDDLLVLGVGLCITAFDEEPFLAAGGEQPFSGRLTRKGKETVHSSLPEKQIPRNYPDELHVLAKSVSTCGDSARRETRKNRYISREKGEWALHVVVHVANSEQMSFHNMWWFKGPMKHACWCWIGERVAL